MAEVYSSLMHFLLSKGFLCHLFTYAVFQCFMRSNSSYFFAVELCVLFTLVNVNVTVSANEVPIDNFPPLHVAFRVQLLSIHVCHELI